MIVFLDSNQKQWDEAPAELGGRFEIAQLITPLTRYSDRGGKYAIDNGAFSGFKADAFRSLLERQKPHQDRCVFVAVPDVVGSARRTLEVFRHWYGVLSVWPLALVAQDGIEDLDIPWDLLAAVFVGGSTDFKLSESAVHVIRAAQAIGKWVHIGRVNTPERVEKFTDLGVDSIDGTGLSRFGWMRRAISSGRYEPLFAGNGSGESEGVGSCEQGVDTPLEVDR